MCVLLNKCVSFKLPIRQRPKTLLDSSKSVNTSPAATVYLCQRSSKVQDELFIQCAPWETGSYNTYLINKTPLCIKVVLLSGTSLLKDYLLTFNACYFLT